MSTVKVAYGSPVVLTFTSLGSLAASAAWLAGAESAAVDNSSALNDDFLLAGNFKVGAANGKAGRFEVWVVAPMDGDASWPDVFDGTDSAETWSNADAKNAGAKLVAVINVTATTADLVYPMAPVSVASFFGGICPRKFSVFVTHDVQTSTNAIAAASDGPPVVNKMWVVPITYTVA